MTTPTTQPAQAGREKCAAPEWCGMKEIGHDPRDKAYFSDERDNIGVVIDGHIYCSLDCQAASLPSPRPPRPRRERDGQGNGGRSISTVDILGQSIR